MAKTISVIVALACLGLAAFETEARCTPIGRVPTAIDRPGKYCLYQDHSVNLAAGQAISVSADDVLLDFRGHKIGNTFSAADTTAIGIHTGSSGFVTIENGTLEGFKFGINMAGPAGFGRGNIVTRMRILNSNETGIRLGTVNALVRDNVVENIGDFSSTDDACGIAVILGGDARIVGNRIFGVRSSTNAAAICFVAGSGVVEGNYTQEIGLDAGGLMNGPGVYADIGGFPGSVVVADNRFQGFPSWEAGSSGVLINATDSDEIGLCRDNTITFYATDLNGCLDAGNTCAPGACVVSP